MYKCLMGLILRMLVFLSKKAIKFPLIEEVSLLSVVVLPFCITFVVVWAVNQHISFACIGQDFMGIALMITILQIVRIPNIKVDSILLICGFMYDIF